MSQKYKSDSIYRLWSVYQWTGGKPPFGYLRNKETGEWLIDPVAGKYVRMVFDKAIEGCNTSQISYYMNEQKIPTPGRYNKENGLTHYGYNQKLPESEVLWNCGMVRAILGRYEYTGALVQGKRQSIAVGSKVTRKSKDKDVVITKDTHRQYYDLDYNSLLVELDLEFDHQKVNTDSKQNNRNNHQYSCYKPPHSATPPVNRPCL